MSRRSDQAGARLTAAKVRDAVIACGGSATARDVADYAGVSVSQAARFVKALVNSGALVTDRGAGALTRYSIKKGAQRR